MKYILLFLLIMGCGKEQLTKPETFEIKDKITKNIHIFRKEPKLKKSILYCIKDKERKVVWVDWHPDQTPEFTYRVDSYANYIEKTWVEQHYGYRIAP